MLKVKTQNPELIILKNKTEKIRRLLIKLITMHGNQYDFEELLYFKIEQLTILLEEDEIVSKEMIQFLKCIDSVYEQFINGEINQIRDLNNKRQLGRAVKSIVSTDNLTTLSMLVVLLEYTANELRLLIRNII